jgi:hypothetical protein
MIIFFLISFSALTFAQYDGVWSSSRDSYVTNLFGNLSICTSGSKLDGNMGIVIFITGTISGSTASGKIVSIWGNDTGNSVPLSSSPTDVFAYDSCNSAANADTSVCAKLPSTRTHWIDFDGVVGDFSFILDGDSISGTYSYKGTTYPWSLRRVSSTVVDPALCAKSDRSSSSDAESYISTRQGWILKDEASQLDLKLSLCDIATAYANKIPSIAAADDPDTSFYDFFIEYGGLFGGSPTSGLIYCKFVGNSDIFVCVQRNPLADTRPYGILISSGRFLTNDILYYGVGLSPYYPNNIMSYSTPPLGSDNPLVILNIWQQGQVSPLQYCKNGPSTTSPTPSHASSFLRDGFLSFFLASNFF